MTTTEIHGDHRQQIASALRSPLELKEALRLLVGIVLESTGADHVSIFLVENNRLLPAVALRKDPSPDAWQAMKMLGPIRLNKERTRAFVSGEPVVIDDVRGNFLVPDHVVEKFSLRSMAMVAMRTDDTICGVLAAGRDEIRPFSDGEVEALGSLAVHAARAVVQARPFESVRRKARLQEALARGSAALASPLEDEEIASRLVGAFAELLDTGLCAVALVDDDQVRMRTVVATQPIERRTPIPFSEVPLSLVHFVQEAWLRSSGPGPVEIEDDPWVDELFGSRRLAVRRHLLVPLVVYDRIKGAVVLGFRNDVKLDAEEHAAVEALAAMGTAALERHVLLERLARQVRQVETLHALGAELAHGANAEALVTRINEVLKAQGAEVVGVVFRDPKLARYLGANKPTAEERAAWHEDRWVKLAGGSWSVPMKLEGRVVGSLRVHAGELERAERTFIEALGSGLAEMANRGVLHLALEDAGRERALEVERTRIAGDLHDTVGQLLVAIQLLAGRLSDDLPSASAEQAQISRLANLASQGKRSIDDAVRALAFVPAAKRGIAASLKALTGSVEEDSGIAVSMTITGRPVRLSPVVERALYRVAHEALSNAWRHARCRRIQVDVTFGSLDVSLQVADDGTGLESEIPAGGRHMGLSSMRRAMADVGGTFELTDRRPKGLVVEARVARGAW